MRITLTFGRVELTITVYLLSVEISPVALDKRLRVSVPLNLAIDETCTVVVLAG